MPDISYYMSDYGSYHKTKGNMITHCFGIPIIVISIMGLLMKPWAQEISLLGLFKIEVNIALILWFVVSLFYIYLHRVLGATMIVSMALMYFIGGLLPVPALWTLFVVGWIIQFIGHLKYEGNSPAFYKNGLHLLIGPMYIQNYLLKIYKVPAKV